LVKKATTKKAPSSSTRKRNMTKNYKY